MIRRFVSLVLLVWLAGFVWFAVALPQPLAGGRSDAVVVLTGGPGRIGRGLEALDKGWARQMLVSGVDREVKPREFAYEYKVPDSLMTCCITLGFASVDTRSNASETEHWIASHKFRSIRLVTTDWHMRRAALELQAALPDDVELTYDAVRSQPSLRTLFLEYHKFIARAGQRLAGL